MKRSALKRKTSLRRRTPLRKKSKMRISLLQRKVWDECKRIIRKRYGAVCYTCGQKRLEKSNWHTGHLFPKAALSAYLKYDLRLLRPQCYHCNINLGGNGAVFIEKMRLIEGDRYVDSIVHDRRITIGNAYAHYEQLLALYQTVDN
jgi:hypothetical protein